MKGDSLPFPSGLSRDGFTLFSFCLLLQNHTLTTSFSMESRSAREVISSLVGFGFKLKAFSRAPRTVVSIEVRFFLLRPMISGVTTCCWSTDGSKTLWRNNLLIFHTFLFYLMGVKVVCCSKNVEVDVQHEH